MHLFTAYIILLSMVYSTFASADIQPIDKTRCQKMHKAGVINNQAPVPCSRLKLVRFQHINFAGEKQQGELIVMDAIAPYVEKVMQHLLTIHFPIHQANPMVDYQGDDQLSMNSNNSSAFNYRAITGKKSLSLHAYGVAIDINPLQNPYISFTSWGTATFQPLQGHKYLNRKQWRLNKSDARGFAEQVVTTFAEHGFLIWGGDWDSPIDFQHFQTTREVAVLMAKMPAKQAAIFFNQYVDWYRQCKAFSDSDKQDLTIKDYSKHLKQVLNSNNLKKTFLQAPTKLLAQINRPLKAQPNLCFQ